MLGRLETVHKIAEKQGLPVDTKWKQQPRVPTSRRHKTVSVEREEDPLSFYRKVATQKKRKRESGSRVKMAFQEDLQPLEGKRAITYQVIPTPLPTLSITVLKLICVVCRFPEIKALE